MNSIKRTVQEIFKTKPAWMELPAQRRYCRYPGCGRVFKPIDALEEFCSRECLQDFNWSPPTPWYPPPKSGWWRRGRSDAGPPLPQFPQRAATIQLIPMKGLPPLNLPPLGEDFPKPQRRKGWLGRAGHQHSHSHQGTFRPQAAPPPATVKPRAAPPPATVRPRAAPPPATVRPRVAPPPAAVKPRVAPPATFRPRAEPPPAPFIGRPAVAPAAPTLRPRTRAHDLPRPPSSKYKNMPLPPIRCERPLPPLPPRARRLSASGVILPPPYLHFHPELLPQQPVRPRHHAPSRRGPRPRSNSFGGFRFPPPQGHSNQRHHNH